MQHNVSVSRIWRDQTVKQEEEEEAEKKWKDLEGIFLSEKSNIQK